MNAATLAQWDLAEWLLAQEMGAGPESEALPDAAERASQKLCRRLAQLVTLTGSHALLARALHLARADFPFLDGVRVGATDADTCLVGLRASVEGVEPATMRGGLTAVLAGVIGLLTIFIGEDLSLGLVRDVWSDAPTSGAGPRAEEAHT